MASRQASPAQVRLPRRVCIFGASLDVENRGVRALGVSLARLCARASPDTEIVFHYGSSSGASRRLSTPGQDDLEIKVMNCRMSPRSAPREHIGVVLLLALLYRVGLKAPARRNPWLRSLLDADFVGEIRGGDSFSDIYGFRRFLVGCLPLLSVILLGRPYAMLPQTYGPFSTRTSRWLARLLLRRADRIFTRDRNCEATVFALAGRAPAFCPDVAFTLEATEPVAVQFAPAEPVFDRDGLVIGLNVSGLLYMGGYTGRNMFGLRTEYRELVHAVLDDLLRSTTATILLVPHVFGEQEEQACRALLQSAGASHPGRVFAVAQPLTEREIKWVIGRTHFFIGSRMHACIAAISQRVPTVGLAYSDKFLGVFESAGVGDMMIDLRTTATAEVVGQIKAAIGQRRALSARLEERIAAVQQQIFDSFRDMLLARPAA